MVDTEEILDFMNKNIELFGQEFSFDDELTKMANNKVVIELNNAKEKFIAEDYEGFENFVHETKDKYFKMMNNNSFVLMITGEVVYEIFEKLESLLE